MKKIEKSIRTDRYEVQVVTFEPEEEDWNKAARDQRPGTAVAVVTPEPYIMIGPPGGQLARFDGLDVDVLQLLVAYIQPYGLRRGPRAFPPGACPPPYGVP